MGCQDTLNGVMTGKFYFSFEVEPAGPQHRGIDAGRVITAGRDQVGRRD